MFCGDRRCPPSSESSGKSEFRLTQTASVSGGQPARKMVDAVHERFNIDLHLEVGASRDFAQSGGLWRSRIGRRSFMAIFGHRLMTVISSTSRAAGERQPYADRDHVADGEIRPAASAAGLRLANATPSSISPASATLRTVQQR